MWYWFDDTFANYKKWTQFYSSCHISSSKVCGGLDFEDFDQERNSTICVWTHWSCFGILLEMISENDTQFISDVWVDLMKCLAIKQRFTTMYESSTNGLVERTNKILCSMIAKQVETRLNASDWDLKIHHAKWIYNSKIKLLTCCLHFV